MAISKVWLVTFFTVLFVCFIVSQLFLKQSAKYNDDIPIVGLRNQLFKTTRASFRQLTNGIQTLSDGYDQYSKHGKPFLLQEPSLQKELMLPPEHIKWFSNQPDSVLKSEEIRMERHAVRYLHVGVEFDSTLFFLDRIAGDCLTRKLDQIQAPMHDELRRSIDQVFGTDVHEWKTVNVYNSMQEMLLPAMSCTIFGLPLGRDPKFNTLFSRYILAMGIGTIVIGQLPKVFKGLAVPLFNVPLRYYRGQCLKALIPLVRKTLAKTGDDGRRAGEDKDFISQSVRLSAKMKGTGGTTDPKTIAEWIMLLGFAAMSSTVIQMTNILLDIVSCPPEDEVYETIREEASNIFKSLEDYNDITSFKKLPLLDSAIRESLRYHPILIKGLSKEVVRSEGVKLPDGTHVPQGSWMGIPVLGMHFDERFYPQAQKYDPFRSFNLKLERAAAQLKDKSIEKRSISDLDAGQPSSTYLGFGYGKHSCPGRWFAVLMIKVVMAYLTLNYEIEATGPRSNKKVFGDAALPPISATVRIRRRKGIVAL